MGEQKIMFMRVLGGEKADNYYAQSSSHCLASLLKRGHSKQGV